MTSFWQTSLYLICQTIGMVGECMVIDDIMWWFGLIVLGFGIGIITGLFGIGGGFLLTPALRIFFDISYPVAIGSSLLQITATSMLSVYNHWRQQNLDLKLGSVTIIGSLAGTECGVRLLHAISMKGTIEFAGYSTEFMDLLINTCFFLLMACVAGFMLREVYQSNKTGIDEPDTGCCKLLHQCSLPPFMCFEQAAIPRLSFWVPTGLSFIVGCLTGLLGIGGGFVSLPLMIYLLGVPTRIAVGTSTLQVLLASAYGMFRHHQAGHVNVLLVIFMFFGSLAGVNAGVRLAKRVNARDTRKYFAGVLIGGLLLIVYDVVRKLNG